MATLGVLTVDSIVVTDSLSVWLKDVVVGDAVSIADTVQPWLKDVVLADTISIPDIALAASRISALIKFAQGANVGVGGEAFVVATGTAVTITNYDNTLVASWQIDLYYTPQGSSVERAVPHTFNNSSSTPSASVTPDVSGSYRVQLTVWDTAGRIGASSVDIRVFAVREAGPLAWIRPPAQIYPLSLPTPESSRPNAKPEELNFGNQPYGWSGAQNQGLMDDILRRISAEDSVSTILWVDAGTALSTASQDGSIEKPYATVQQAIDHGAASALVSWHIQVAFGDYSSQSLTIPQEKDFVIEGRIRRGLMTLGSVTWTVTGNQTSRLAFRRVIVGSLSIADGAAPATDAVLSFVDSQAGSITTLGTSITTVVLAGVSLASFDVIATPNVASIVTGPVNLLGTLLAQNTQFQATCTLLSVTTLLADGSSFEQDIRVSNTVSQLQACVWTANGFDIEFTGSAGMFHMDSSTLDSFLDHAGTITNGNVSSDYQDLSVTGFISGGVVRRVSGLTLSIAAGFGSTVLGTSATYVGWMATTIAAPTNTSFQVYVDSTGTIFCGTGSDPEQHIILSKGYADGSDVIVLSRYDLTIRQLIAKRLEYARDVVGPVTVSGVAASIYSTPSRQVSVSSGTFYVDQTRLTATASTPITFRYWYRNGSGGWTTIANQIQVDNAQYDDGDGTRAAIPASAWKKDLLFVSVSDDGTEYHVVYGQETFSTQGLAEAGANPLPPDQVLRSALRVAGIVLQLSGNIASVVDARPFLGQLSTGSTSTTDHGLLSGLGDDDHTQYLLTNGSRAMSGGLDMGANAISNVGTVDGVDVSAHASRHNPGGADALATATAATVTDSTNAEGSATSYARSDHTHSHGTRGGGTLHAAVTTSVDGFMSAADKALLDLLVPASKRPVRAATTANITLSGTQTVDGVSLVAGNRCLVKDQSTGANNGIYNVASGSWTRTIDFDVDAEVRGGLLVPISEGTVNGDRVAMLTTNDPITVGSTTLTFAMTQVPPLTSTAPADVTKAAAAVGTSTLAARQDHKHDVTTATVQTLTDSTNAEGTATSLARSDHTHSHGTRGGGTLHADATTSVSGFLSGADKTKLDNMFFGQRQFGGADFDDPNSSNWTINAAAALAADSSNAGLVVRRFDDTTEEGVGFDVYLPVGSTNIIFRFVSRAQTAPGSTQTVRPVLYVREIPDNAAVEAWSSATLMTTISIPNNANFQYDSQTIALSTLSLVAGRVAQFELTRRGTDGSDSLSGDWVLQTLVVEFT
jgi:hypothetical protein